VKVLELNDISFSYKETLVLSDFSYTFKKGKIYAVVGHNGAGKTTLLWLCLKLLKPKQGTVAFAENTTVSFMPDRGGVFNHLTVEQNIRVSMAVYHINKDSIEKNVVSALKKWRLEAKRKSLATNLSLGEKQRLSFILAEINNADIMFLDEPTSNIDIVSQELLNSRLIELKELGKTVIVSSHDIKLIESVGDEIIIIDDTRIVYSGEMKDVSNLATLYRKHTEVGHDNENN